LLDSLLHSKKQDMPGRRYGKTNGKYGGPVGGYNIAGVYAIVILLSFYFNNIFIYTFAHRRDVLQCSVTILDRSSASHYQPNTCTGRSELQVILQA
jgi:hypothetical protein